MIRLSASPQGHVGYFIADIKGGNFHRYLEIVKEIPTRQWDKVNEVWKIGLVDFEILRKDLRKTGLTDIEITPQLQTLVAQYKKWELDLVNLIASEDLNLSINPNILKIQMMPHQKVALEFMLRRKVGLNGSEMGSGKSFPAIACAKHLIDTGEAKDCLVVCITSVKWNWTREIDKCVHGATYTVVEGDPMDRAAKYASPAMFKIVNYETLRNDIDVTLAGRVFDCIIVDEIHRIRTYNAKQTKTLYSLGKTAKYRFGLTGTPIHNHLKDLFSIMRFIHPGILGEWFTFERRYCVRGYFGNIKGYKNLEEVHGKLKTIMFRRLKADVMKYLPPKVYNDIYIEMGKRQKEFYEDVRDKILQSNLEEVEEKIKQANILANLTYLREVCDSAELIDPEVQESRKIDELKILVPELVENGHKVVIFSQFEKMTRIIERDLGLPAIRLHGGISTGKGVRDAMVDEFNTSKTKNVFIMTQAGGEGINLQVADYIILFDLPFNPQVIAQVEDRLHRKGQTNTVNVIRLIAKNTIEDRVLEILKYKINLFKKVVDGVSEVSTQITQKELLIALKDVNW